VRHIEREPAFIRPPGPPVALGCERLAILHEWSRRRAHSALSRLVRSSAPARLTVATTKSSLSGASSHRSRSAVCAESPPPTASVKWAFFAARAASGPRRAAARFAERPAACRSDASIALTAMTAYAFRPTPDKRPTQTRVPPAGSARRPTRSNIATAAGRANWAAPTSAPRSRRRGARRDATRALSALSTIAFARSRACRAATRRPPYATVQRSSHGASTASGRFQTVGNDALPNRRRRADPGRVMPVRIADAGSRRDPIPYMYGCCRGAGELRWRRADALTGLLRRSGRRVPGREHLAHVSGDELAGDLMRRLVRRDGRRDEVPRLSAIDRSRRRMRMRRLPL